MAKEIILIGIAFMIFSVLHSITASQSFKNKIKSLAGTRFFEGWFRFLYNVLSLISLVPILLLIRGSSPIVWKVEGFAGIVLNAVRIMGIEGIIISLWQIDWRSFLGIRQLKNFLGHRVSISGDEVLVTKGLYRFTRHPLYFFSLLFIWFNPVMNTTWLVFSIGTTLYFFIGSYFEEKKMIKQFGDQYRDYRKSVSWIIPFFKIDPNR